MYGSVRQSVRSVYGSRCTKDCVRTVYGSRCTKDNSVRTEQVRYGAVRTAPSAAVAEGLFRQSRAVMRLRELHVLPGTPTGDQQMIN